MPKVKLRTVDRPKEMTPVPLTNVPEGTSGSLLTINEGLYHELWQDTQTAHVYRSSKVKTNNPNYYLTKVDREGNRVFFTAMELDGLDPGWRTEAEASIPKFKCPIPSCTKKFPEKAVDGVHGLLKLQAHIAGFHGREYSLGYKERLENRIREEIIGTGDMEIDA